MNPTELLQVKMEGETSSDDETPDNPKDETFGLPCKYCTQIFFVKRSLDTHMSAKHAEHFVCHICNEQQKSENTLKMHIRRHEKEKKLEEIKRLTGKVYKFVPRSKKQQCQVCQKLVVSVENHMRSAHTHERPFSCPHCAGSYVSQKYLDTHIQVIHEKRFNHVCRFCGKGFAQQSALTEHERKHTGERPFACELCGKTFFRKHSLKNHHKVHTDTANFQCDICSKKYKNSNALRDHRKSHFDEHKRFSCHICNKRFLKNSVLKLHMMTHSNVKPYNCDLCGNDYMTKYLLTKHIFKHTNFRAHVCELCGNRYNTKHNLLRHAASVHRDAGLYVSCDICGKFYASSNILLNHKFKAHPETSK